VGGHPESARCGLSMRVVQVLDSLDIEYGATDVLPALRPLRSYDGDLRLAVAALVA
jgi:glutaredoxin-related protein